MNAVTRRKIEMAKRVRSFTRAHPSNEQGYVGWLARIEAAVDKAEALIVQQRAGQKAEQGATDLRKQVRARLHKQLLPHLVTAGVAASQEQPTLWKTFQLPRTGATSLVYAAAVHQMLTQAQAEAELFTRVGLSASLLDDVTAAVSQFEQAVEQGHTARAEHTAASAEFDTVILEVRAVVALLDGFNRYRFANDAALLAAWEGAKNVVGPFRGSEGTPPDSKAA